MGTLREDVYTFMTAYRWILLRMRNVWDKSYRGNQSTHFVFKNWTPNGHCMGRTTQLTSRCCILYIYSTNIRTEYFKYPTYSPFSLSSKCRLFHNATFFASRIIHILNTGCAKIYKEITAPKG